MKERLAPLILGALAGVFAGYIGAQSEATDEQSSGHIAVSRVNCGESSASVAHSSGRAATGSPDQGSGDAGPPAESPEVAEERALVTRQLVSQLSVRAFDAESALEHIPDATIETAINMTNEYQSGWIDAVTSNPDTDYAEMREEFADRLCDSNASDVQRGMLLALSRRLPETASNRGVDCVLEDQTEEGALLWYAIDAHTIGRLQLSPAMRHWQESATDPRTLRRFDEFMGRDPDVMRAGGT